MRYLWEARYAGLPTALEADDLEAATRDTEGDLGRTRFWYVWPIFETRMGG
jgi:hypothetical protein